MPFGNLFPMAPSAPTVQPLPLPIAVGGGPAPLMDPQTQTQMAKQVKQQAMPGLKERAAQLQKDVAAIRHPSAAPPGLKERAEQLQKDVATISQPANPAEPAEPTPIDYGAQVDRQQRPLLQGSVFGNESGPVRYVTNGGRSELIGGYGDNSLLANWAVAQFFGQGDPVTMAQKNALARTMAVRNSGEYQNIYQQALQQTGNPTLAAAQTDALFAEQMPNYSGDFINSGQDLATQQRFDVGIARNNSNAMINPYAGTPVYKNHLPVWGNYAAGVSPTGEDIVVTPDGTAVQMPQGGFSPLDLNALMGQPGAAVGPNSATMTPYQRQQLVQGEERNRQSMIRNLQSQNSALYTRLGNIQKIGGDPQEAQAIQAQIDANQRQINQYMGITTPAQPTVINTNSGST